MTADLGPPTELVLARHGRTDATRRVLSGGTPPGPPLNDAGLDEAAALGAYLATLAPDVLITTPLLRNRQTAGFVAGTTGLTALEDEGWSEARHGGWDGLSVREIAERWPGAYREWAEASDVPAPDGESYEDVRRRVLAARDSVLAAHPGRRVVVISHVTPIRVVVADALAAGPAARRRLRIDPCSLSVVRYWADGGCEVVGVNGVGHLAGALG